MSLSAMGLAGSLHINHISLLQPSTSCSPNLEGVIPGRCHEAHTGGVGGGMGMKYKHAHILIKLVWVYLVIWFWSLEMESRVSCMHSKTSTDKPPLSTTLGDSSLSLYR